MHNILVLSFEGFSFSSRQLYQQLLPKLLSRAVVHESTESKDALNYIATGWPSTILVTDPFITQETDESRRLLDAVVAHTKQGCVTLLIGFFAAAVQYPRFDHILKHSFDLPWRVGAYTTGTNRLVDLEQHTIRRASLIPSFYTKSVYLQHVPPAHMIYAGPSGPSRGYSGSGGGVAYAAFASVEFGKLGYIGDVDFGEEPEKLILAMCRLDREEDWLRESEDRIEHEEDDMIEEDDW